MSRTPRKTGSPAPENVPSLLGAETGEGASSYPSIRVGVVRLTQKGVVMYVGKMRAANLLRLWEIDKFRDEDLEGYQRRLYDDRTQQVLDYLTQCPIAVMPGILVSLREGANFKPISEGLNVGALEIPNYQGSIWVIDGQHRLGGLQLGLKGVEDELSGMETVDSETRKMLEDYEVPVVFIDSASACESIKPSLRDPSVSIAPSDVERVVFFIVNKTAKSISPSLKDALAYKIKAAGIEGIPIIEKEPWRVPATRISLALFRDGRTGSPFTGLMKITGIETRVTRGVGRPLTLSSFVTSLRPLIENERFKNISSDPKLAYEQQLAFVATYWRALRRLHEDPFKEPQNYMILKSIGVYALNLIANDVFNWCSSAGSEPTENNIMKFIKPLKDFDWSKKTSPLAAFGGQKGVRAAYKLLLRNIAEKGVAEASGRLTELEEEETT